MMSTSMPYTAVMVPEAAVSTDQTKKFVYVVGDDGQPQFREIKQGALIGGMRVLNGDTVKAGENVIVDGLQRVVPGMKVSPQVLKVNEQGLPIFPPPQAPGGPGATPAGDMKKPDGGKPEQKKPDEKKASLDPFASPAVALFSVQRVA
jgi:hypothetical protein